MIEKQNDDSLSEANDYEQVNTGVPRSSYDKFQLNYTRCPIHGITYPKGESCPAC